MRALGPFIYAATACACDAGGEPPPIDPVVTQALLDSGELVEVVSCRHSHEHELNHVRTVADPEAARLFKKCVLDRVPGDPADSECDRPYPEGTLFVKYEYELEGCRPEDFKGLSANLKLAPGSYPEGRDWRWQRLTPKLKVTEDGAPLVCLLCHIDHCSPPDGHDLRCLPD